MTTDHRYIQLSARDVRRLVEGLDEDIVLKIAQGTYSNVARDLLKHEGSKLRGQVMGQLQEAIDEAVAEEIGLVSKKVKDGWTTRTKHVLNSKGLALFESAAGDLIRDRVRESVRAEIEKQTQDERFTGRIKRMVDDRIDRHVTGFAKAASAKLHQGLMAHLRASLGGAS